MGWEYPFRKISEYLYGFIVIFILLMSLVLLLVIFTPLILLCWLLFCLCLELLAKLRHLIGI